MKSGTHLFSRTIFTENAFFPMGRPLSQPLQVAFPLQKRVVLRSQKTGVLWKVKLAGEVCEDREKKENKAAQKGEAKSLSRESSVNCRLLSKQVKHSLATRNHSHEIRTPAFPRTPQSLQYRFCVQYPNE